MKEWLGHAIHDAVMAMMMGMAMACRCRWHVRGDAKAVATQVTE
jgi:hypothetical protein